MRSAIFPPSAAATSSFHTAARLQLPLAKSLKESVCVCVSLHLSIAAAEQMPAATHGTFFFLAPNLQPC